MKKGDENRFIGGPWPHHQGFEIKYSLNGKVRSEYRKDPVEAQSRADYWKTYFEDPAQARKRTEEVENTVHYWDRVLRKHAELVLRDPENKALIAAARALSQLAAEGLKCAKIAPPREGDSQGDSKDLDSLSTEELSALLEATN